MSVIDEKSIKKLKSTDIYIHQIYSGELISAKHLYPENKVIICQYSGYIIMGGGGSTEKKGVLDNMMLIRIESSVFMLYAVLILMFLVLTIIVKKRSDVASGGSYVALNQKTPSAEDENENKHPKAIERHWG